MIRPTTLADRRRYLEDGLVDLACDHCGGTVRVKKNSVEQTTVQWTVAAANGCAEFVMRRNAGQLSALVATCGRLRATIDRAVAEGRLRIVPAEGTPVEPAPRGAPVEPAPRGAPPHGGPHEPESPPAPAAALGVAP
jgi:hypothetical protein